MRHRAQKSDSSDDPSSGEMGRGAEYAKRVSDCEADAGGSVISPFYDELLAFAMAEKKEEWV